MKATKPKLKINDTVRVEIQTTDFAKKYLPTFSEETYVVSKVIRSNPTTYKLSAEDGEELLQTWYYLQLQKVEK